MDKQRNENREQEFLEGKEKYLDTPLPEELADRVTYSMKQGEHDMKKSGTFKIIGRIGMGVAAALALFIALPNVNGNIAYAMSNAPVIGNLAKAVTFREYHYDDGDRYQADVEVPKLVTEDGSTSEDMDHINLDMDAITEEAIADFKESSQMGEGYEQLDIKHETVTDNDKYLTLKLMVYVGAGSGSETDYYYTVSKITGEKVQLSDLFTDGTYVDAISKEIIRQMKAQMKASDKVTYFIDGEMPGSDFEQIDDNADFYFNKDGQLVITFDEYEVAPGSMGTVEFVIPDSVTGSLYK